MSPGSGAQYRTFGPSEPSHPCQLSVATFGAIWLLLCAAELSSALEMEFSEPRASFKHGQA